MWRVSAIFTFTVMLSGATVRGAAIIPYPEALDAAAVRQEQLSDIMENSLILGNGDINGLLWEQGGALTLRLTKNDVWDARIDTSEDPPLLKIDVKNKKLAGPLSSLAVLASMSDAGREVGAADLVSLYRSLEKQLKAAGLEQIGVVDDGGNEPDRVFLPIGGQSIYQLAADFGDSQRFRALGGLVEAGNDGIRGAEIDGYFTHAPSPWRFLYQMFHSSKQR